MTVFPFEKEKIKEIESRMAAVREVFRILDDPNGFKLVCCLIACAPDRGNARRLAYFLEDAGIKGSLSFLNKLIKCGLVDFEEEDQVEYYHLKDGPITDALSMMVGETVYKSIGRSRDVFL